MAKIAAKFPFKDEEIRGKVDCLKLRSWTVLTFEGCRT